MLPISFSSLAAAAAALAALALAALVLLTRRLERAEEAFIQASLRALAANPGAVYVVTGATSGIGEHLAGLLASCGAEVYLCHRSATRGAAARARLLARHPAARLRLLHLDVTQPASVRAAARALRAAHARIDGVVCNAGAMPAQSHLRWGALARALCCCRLGAFLETGRPGARAAHFIAGGAPGSLLGAHVLGHLLLLQELGGALARGRSRVVWSGSRAAEPGAVDWASLSRGRLAGGPPALPLEAYAEAKVLQELASRALAARAGLDSLVVCPGFVETPITPGFFAAFSPLLRPVRALAPSMTLELRRGCAAHLGALAAAQGQLSPAVKWVLRGGALGPCGRSGRVPAGLEDEAWRVCQEWLAREGDWTEGGEGEGAGEGAGAGAAQPRKEAAPAAASPAARRKRAAT